MLRSGEVAAAAAEQELEEEEEEGRHGPRALDHHKVARCLERRLQFVGRTAAARHIETVTTALGTIAQATTAPGITDPGMTDRPYYPGDITIDLTTRSIHGSALVSGSGPDFPSGMRPSITDRRIPMPTHTRIPIRTLIRLRPVTDIRSRPLLRPLIPTRARPTRRRPRKSAVRRNSNSHRRRHV